MDIAFGGPAGAGKTFAARTALYMLRSLGLEARIDSLAAPLKEIVDGGLRVKDDPERVYEICRRVALRTVPSEPNAAALRWRDAILAGSDRRTLLQRVGTELGRDLYGDLWIRSLLMRRSGITIVDDVRFHDEARELSSEGFLVVRLECPEEERLRRLTRRDGDLYSEGWSSHRSEEEASRIEVDLVLYNGPGVDINDIARRACVAAHGEDALSRMRGALRIGGDLVIDVDSTVWDLYGNLKRSFARRGIEITYREITSWDYLTERYGKTASECFREAVREDISERELYPGFLRCISLLKEFGMGVRFISHNAEPEEMLGPVGEWLKKKTGIDRLDIFSPSESKLVPGAVGIIDDNPKTLIEYADNGLFCATLAHPWNEELADDRRVLRFGSWDDLCGEMAEGYMPV